MRQMQKRCPSTGQRYASQRDSSRTSRVAGIAVSLVLGMVISLPAISAKGSSLSTPVSRSHSLPQSWVPILTAVHPSNRSGFAMAYDWAGQYIVGFGGVGPNGRLFTETWVFKGGNWSKLPLKIHPPPDVSPYLAYDSATKRIIEFGGIDSDVTLAPTALNQTWAFSGGNWTRLHPVHSPAHPLYGLMGYDAGNRRVVLYAVFLGPNRTSSTETWTYANGDWRHLVGAGGPPSYFSGLAYDPSYHGLILGDNSNKSFKSWVLRNGSWNHLNITNAPSNVSKASGLGMVYDPRYHVLLLVVSFSHSPETTWTLASGNWTKASPSTSPPSRFGFGMAFDAIDGYVVQFGGYDSGVAFDDTWAF